MDLLEKRLRDRLESLRAEFAEGKQQLQQMKQDQDALVDDLLLLFGAIHVLAEELGDTVETGFDQSLGLGADDPATVPSGSAPTNELRLVDPVDPGVRVEHG
jgi:predicted nuclease with TOPRIM domain